MLGRKYYNCGIKSMDCHENYDRARCKDVEEHVKLEESEESLTCKNKIK
jgi:uncharacterized protein (DUF2164 family)